ncbi:hypothetical protein LWI28_020569 [Acer negundo]|uniref:Squalene monooxygenase n=1 Tax=Acer negundo TaxID=4023 RepID=A0AAD5J629_ACENE|nr:hypothetical protein LWI28_020569 [Acer negundo]
MVYYILGAVVASLLGLLFLKISIGKKKSGASSMEAQSTDSVMGRSGNGSTDTDIVIVGAGVAGAALAYTLGKVEIPSCFVGLILEKCELPYKNHGHVILADPSPILFYPISSTEIRCLVDVPGQRVPSISNGEMNHYLKTVIAPQIPSELLSAFMVAIEKGHIRTMTNRSMPATPQPTPGALLLGDAFNMRHPLTGGGMTVALSDIVVLRDLLRPLRDLNDAPALCKYLESFYTLRKPVASTINTLAGALYKVFCASPDPSRKEMRQACFDYLSLGGDFTNGPIALLSGLNPRPLSLVTHFFAVAIYGVGRLLLPFPSPKRMLIGARLISVRISAACNFNSYTVNQFK